MHEDLPGLVFALTMLVVVLIGGILLYYAEAQKTERLRLCLEHGAPEFGPCAPKP